MFSCEFLKIPKNNFFYLCTTASVFKWQLKYVKRVKYLHKGLMRWLYHHYHTQNICWRIKFIIKGYSDNKVNFCHHLKDPNEWLFQHEIQTSDAATRGVPWKRCS